MIYDSMIASALAGINPEQTTSQPSDEQLKKAATEFEALFLYELLKEMPMNRGLTGKGLGGDVYETLFKLELSRELAQQGTGIRDMILKAVKQRYNKPSGEL